MLIKYIKKSYHRVLLEDLLKKNKNLINGNILDIGSKNRRYDSLFDGEVIAVDKNPQNKNVIKGDIEKGLDYEDRSFDSILCIEVFEYLDSYEKAIKEISRLLKNDGIAIISFPFMYHDHGDNIRFTKKFIVEKFKVHFSDVKSLGIGNSFVIIWDILRKKVLGIKNRTVRSFCFLLLLPYLLIVKIFRLENKSDKFYSGIFLIMKK